VGQPAQHTSFGSGEASASIHRLRPVGAHPVGIFGSQRGASASHLRVTGVWREARSSGNSSEGSAVAEGFVAPSSGCLAACSEALAVRWPRPVRPGVLFGGRQGGQGSEGKPQEGKRPQRCGTAVDEEGSSRGARVAGKRLSGASDQLAEPKVQGAETRRTPVGTGCNTPGTAERSKPSRW